MKKLFLSLTAVLFFAFCQAQESAFTPKTQVGFDGSALLSQFFNFNSSSNSIASPYFINMRWYRGDRNSRFGIGANFIVEEIGTEGTSTANFIRFRFGSERFQDFGKEFKNYTYRWRAFYGGDSKLNLEYASISSSDLNSFSLDFGGAPIFGLLFRINERLSLSTELAYNILISFQDLSGETQLKLATQFIAPRSIFLNYDF